MCAAAKNEAHDESKRGTCAVSCRGTPIAVVIQRGPRKEHPVPSEASPDASDSARVRTRSAGRDIVVVGASAGGADAIAAVVRQLPGNIAASLFVVCHQFPGAQGQIVDLLNTAGPLIAKIPEDGEEIRHGVVYVAPPDRHLLVKEGYVRVTSGPRENRWRPAIDPLFRSAAVAYGPRVLGIILSGMLDDGTAGLVAIKRCGGVAMVQDPDEAAYPDMPRTALANAQVDYRLGIAGMGREIARLVGESVTVEGPAPHDLQVEARIAETGYSDETISSQLGELTTLSCPECGGPIWQHGGDGVTRYRCRVGHAYGIESMLSAQDETVESALWAAVRLFDQRANVLTAMAEKDREANRTRMVQHHQKLADEARRHAKQLRTLIIREHE
jgi:two-component system chemotaxis response regulator CheB